MAIEPLTGKLTAAVTGLSTPAGPSAAPDGPQFSKALANVASPPLAEVHGVPPRSGARGAGRRTEPCSGQRTRPADSRQPRKPLPQRPEPEPTLCHVGPGVPAWVRQPRNADDSGGSRPAAAPLMNRPMSEPRPIAATGESNTPDFNAMIRALEQVSTHAIQVSVVSKTTGSFVPEQADVGN